MIFVDMYSDVLIIGTGVAGLYSALNISSDLSVIILSKSKASECDTYLAQGGISKALNEEDKKLFVLDTLKAGHFKNNKKSVEILANESIENISNLSNLGVKFDIKNNTFDYTREGAHSVNRIVHSSDKTGKAVFDALFFNVLNKKNIELIESTCIFDLITENNHCFGAVGIHNSEVYNFHSKVTILACGGIGGIFKNSTNQKTLTADGISIAVKNNIELKDINYIQFHPTALYEENLLNRNFLISESVRGEGAKLLNINNKRFVNELLPRDVVANAIYKEEFKSKSNYVYLDLSSMDGNFIKNRFPLIYNGCMERGIDITKEKIPVTPVQHYFMGGIKVDFNGKTSMNNLYATGEISNTGVHGANRLASNSLLEGLVFSRRASKNINSTISNILPKDIKTKFTFETALNEIHNNKRIAIETFKTALGGKKNELVTL